MKKLLISCVLMTGTAFGQSAVRFDSNVTTTASNVPINASAAVLTVPNAIVTVCAYPPTGNPCTNTVPIFQDQDMTLQVNNPLTTDPKGRFGFWALSGQYSYSVQNQSGQNVGNYPLSLLEGALQPTYTGNYNFGGGVNHLVSLGDGIDPSIEFNATNGFFAETSSVNGSLAVPSTSTTVQSAGVMGQVTSSASFVNSPTNAVGVFGSGRCLVGSCSVWGGNFVAVDAPGTTNDLIWGIEDDVNILSPTTHGYGLDIIGRWAAQPTIYFPAIMVHKPVNFPGDTTSSFGWMKGLEFESGAISGEGAAVTLNPLAQAVSQRSQLIRFSSFNSVGTGQLYSQFEDSAGNMLFLPGGGGPSPGNGIFDSFNVDGSLGVNLVGPGSKSAARFFEPGLATGNATALIMGLSETLNNAAFIQFANNGGTGSTSNQVAIGLLGSDKNLAIDGAGNISFPGVFAQGVGIQHKRGSVGCTTAATAFSTCAGTPQLFAVPFFDTNYTLTCTPTSTAGVATITAITKLSQSFQLSITNLTGVAATANYDCIAMYGID